MTVRVNPKEDVAVLVASVVQVGTVVSFHVALFMAPTVGALDAVRQPGMLVSV